MSAQSHVTPTSSWQDRLDQALSGPGPGPGPASTAELEALVSELERHAQAIQRQDGPSSLEHTPFDDPFPPLLLLTPLLALPADSAKAQLAQEAIDLFASHASAKEVVVALEERIAQVGQASQEQRPDDEDSESGNENEEHVRDPSSHSQLREIVALVDTYAHVFPRINTAKPARFLETATASVTSILRIHCTIHPVTASEAAVLAKMVVDFTETIITKTTWSDTQQQECHVLLRSHLFETAFNLALFFPASLAETYFYSQFPHRRIPHRARPTLDPLVQQAWSTLIDFVRDRFYLELAQLFALAPSNRGVFELFIQVLARDPEDRVWVKTMGEDPEEDLNNGVYSRLLRKTLGLLIGIAREGSSGQGRVDEALFWLWWCVQGAAQEGEVVDEEVVFPLVEVRPITSVQGLRFIAFSLLTTLILDLVPTEATQILSLKDLIETCPYPSLRSASIGILRQVMLRKFDEVDKVRNEIEQEKEGLWLSPLLLIEFEELFKIGPFDLDKSEEADEDRTQTIHEQLLLLYLLLSRDETDRTGIWKGFAKVEEDLLKPLRTRMAREEEGGILGWGVLEVGLERVDTVVEGRGKRIEQGAISVPGGGGTF
ncbi:BZ3500_MvSof-1268-A1-R1_Chr4-3g07288 [Microbotryum saponariae]|uniref:BZ3500_MvSof-1268-A1-R1_Chr4-3g07288 protein n=1 Tax=Microbotryum saponariae TaxID=289078 RepID=A0A2X0LIR7_9BASI|nr:BZ3500_MvSof-1268-A1-R1_Chr4-3g07288 [Microbotryum saponariae]SDA06951.1 BZ3501_MvSof-1269-A2-R1_Chr4-2g06997 [Microbotryum saponariae]